MKKPILMRYNYYRLKKSKYQKYVNEIIPVEDIEVPQTMYDQYEETKRKGEETDGKEILY